ncbi:glycosyl hydrolase [Pseudomonas sp. PDM24]|uniref:WD40/YVTN/BNR-like repeat-containing protein n=1 Tax=Pseudomonas sp. PDM24 TaxID=2854777 RepID=UPI001C46B93F|nr:YCF48-related protein [Pseudomonas sp. PDM24]MBV7495103.1 glycosyl hydrolase [Pseudomonas sp. PDM24]
MKLAFLFRSVPLAALLATVPFMAANADYKDPLDSPATLSPMAASTQLLDIATAGQRLVAVGWRGHILYSDDQGLSWTQANSPVDVDLTAVSFSSPQNGWAVGHSGVVLHTADGGETWSKQLDGRTAGPLMLDYYEKKLKDGDEQAQKYVDDVMLNTEGGPEQPWLDVAFVDDLHGYVVGTFNQILYTADGGKTWVPQMDKVDNPESLHLNAITRDGDAFYIASERGTVFVKSQGDDHFKPSSSGYNGSFFGVLAKNGLVLAYGLKGTLYRSKDHGSTWTAIDAGVDTALTGGAMLDNGRILLVSQGGQLLSARNTNAAIQALSVERPTMFTALVPVESDKVVIVGMAGAQQETLSPTP